MLDEEEDFTAAAPTPPPPLRPRTVIAVALAGILIFGAVIAGAVAARMVNDRREHPNCQTWLSQRDALRRQVAADEQSADGRVGPQETRSWDALAHEFQLREWEKKRPPGCA